MNSSQKEQPDCTNSSSLLFSKTPHSVEWSAEMKYCLFRSIIHNDVVLNISILTIILLFVFSMTINIYLLLGLENSENLSWNPRYKLLKNLIVSDLLITLTFGLPALHCLMWHETLSFNYRCIAQYFTGALALTNSLLTVTSMALERFVYTCHGIHYLSIMTNKRMFCFMILIWFVALSGAGASTALMLMGGANFGHILAGFVCEPELLQAQMKNSVYFETFNKSFIGGVLFLCFLMFVFFYGRMYQEARQVQPFQQDNARARCTISFYFAIFLLQLFASIIKLITLCGNDMDNHIYMIMLVMVPPCVNPVAYGIRNIEVRQALEHLYWLMRIKELFCQ